MQKRLKPWKPPQLAPTKPQRKTKGTTTAPEAPAPSSIALPPYLHPAAKAENLQKRQLHNTTIPPTMPPPVGGIPLSDAQILEHLTDRQSKYIHQVPKRGLMCPGKIAQSHPAGPMLKQYAMDGCPVALEENWSLEQLDEAVKYGAHPSARAPTAAAAVRAEALEKVEQGFAKLVPWSTLREQIQAGLQAHTKISPLAAIPHKSRLFRMILDLSQKGQGRRGQSYRDSVNTLTDPNAAPLKAMTQLGAALPRIIYHVATAKEEDGPILFCKLDIKDGFWRMCVPEANEETFCYVLPPANPSEEVMIVVPAALQMGWISSPPFFCAATETGRDVAERLRVMPCLPEHPLEDKMIDVTILQRLGSPQHWSKNTFAQRLHKLFYLFEVYVDDYCALLQTTDEQMLRHHSRALLHAVHELFPTPDITGHAGENPISQKKLIVDREGVWDVLKEILGWIFDGVKRTMQLPTPKIEKMLRTIRNLLRHKSCATTEFQSIVGKLQHATLGLPTKQAFITPLYHCLKSANPCGKVYIHPQSPQHQALLDCQQALKAMMDEPIDCRQLVPDFPAYIGFCDACKYGAGGIWISGNKQIPPLVWRVKWPEEIVAAFYDEPNGYLTINDLEMAGVLLAYLLLEQLVPMQHTHTALWCDNTSAVSWTAKMSSKKSAVGHQLVRALALRLFQNKASPLFPLSISGERNPQADLASRSFRDTGVHGNYNFDDLTFIDRFNASFPLTQEASWRHFRHHNKLLQRVYSMLLQKPQPTASLMRLPSSSIDIGVIGNNGARSVTWTRFSKAQFKDLCQAAINSTGSVPSLKRFDWEEQAEAIKSELGPSKMRLRPLPRPSNWLA